MKSIFRLVCLSVFMLPVFGHAATYTWDGGGGDNNWTTCANWSSDTCPLSTDDVVFSGTSVKNVSINTNITVVNFSVNAGYTGIITPVGSNTITINGSLSQSSGTLTVSSATTTVVGSFTYTAGTFNHNSGTLYFPSTFAATYSAGSAVLNNVIMEKLGGNGYTQTFSGDMTVNGNLTMLNSINSFSFSFQSNNSATRTISIAGNLLFPNTATNGPMSVGRFDNTQPLVFDLKGNFTLADAEVLVYADMVFSGSSNQTISNSAGSIDSTSDWTDTGSGDFILTSNFVGGMRLLPDSTTDFNFVPTPHTFTVGQLLVAAGGSFTPNGPSSFVIPTFNHSQGTFNATASTTIQNFNQTGGVFNAAAGTTTVTGNFTYTAGTFNHNSGTMYFPVTYGGITYAPNNAIFNNAVFEKTAGSNLTQTFSGDMTVNGNLSFLNTSNSFDVAYQSNNTTPRIITVHGALTFPSTAANGPVGVGRFDNTQPLVFDLKGNFTLADSNINYFSTTNFTGTTTQNVTVTGGTIHTPTPWTINKTSGSVNLTTNISHGGTINVATGTLSTKGFNLSGMTGFTVAASGTLALFGGETITTPTFATGSIALYEGTSTAYTLKNWSYRNLTLQGGSGTTFSLPAALNISQNLNIATGTLDVTASNFGLTVGKNLNNTGVFNPRSGTVTLNGTLQTITGTSTFYNLTKSVTSADTLTFGANQTQIITNTWTANGTSGNVLSLRSTTPGIQWRINPQATRTLSHIDTQDSNNINGTIIATDSTITSSGNNTNWNFDTTPPIVSSIISVPGASTSTISWNTNEVASSTIQYGLTTSYGSTSTSLGTSSHSVILSGLTSETTYNYRIIATDPSGNTSTSTNQIFNTLDVTAPVISAVNATPGSNTASVTWNTNEAASSTIQYGLTTSYGSASTSVGTSSHSVDISGLSANTIYYYRIVATDASGNISTTTDATFTTLDVTPPIVSSIISVPGASTSTISWNTNEVASSTIQYGLTTSYGSTSTSLGTSSHSVILSGLTSETTYNYRIIATDPSGNTSTSTNQIFNTLDVTAPVITPVSVASITTTGAIFTWTTNENASSSILYGLTSTYGSVSTSTESQNHSITLTSLASNTTYHYAYLAYDVSLNISTTTNATFTTLAIPNTEVVIPRQFISGQAIIYGCTDVKAINYNQFSAHLQSLCEYQTTSAIKPTVPTNLTNSSITFVFKKDLQLGMKNNDIKELQKFLNANGYTIATSGPGSKGKETDVFGPATRNAVIKFQKAKKIFPVNGRFGPLTRKNANTIK